MIDTVSIKRNKAIEDIEIPDLSKLVGKRVKNVFMTKQEGSKGRMRTIF